MNILEKLANKYITMDSEKGYVTISKDLPKIGDSLWLTVGGHLINHNLFPEEYLELPWDESLRELLPDGSIIEPRPHIEVDQSIYVRQAIDHEWEPRHFARWLGVKVQCWNNARTSHTECHTSTWNHYKIEEVEGASDKDLDK